MKFSVTSSLRIIILGAVVATIRANLLDCPKDDGTLELYDPTKSQCCFGVEDKQEGKRCCVAEKRFYFTQEKICCDKLYDKVTDGKENYCCGDKKLVSGEDDGLCCHGDKFVYYPNISGEVKEYHDCCGHETYNTYEEQCCEIDYANSVSYNVQPYHRDLECCGLNVINQTQWKCGKNGVQLTFEQEQCYIDGRWKVYNKKEQRCCYDESDTESLHNFSESDHSVRCCGNHLIHAKEEKCCSRGHAIPNQMQYECCGGGYIDRRREKCCSGQAVNITDDHKKYCCGTELINYKKQDCCVGQPYNRTAEQCCGATILPIEDTCCGEAKQEKGDKCCFNRILIKDVPEDHNDCCYNVYKMETRTFNNRIQECRNGKINTKRTDQSLGSCGNELYHKTKDLCCNEKKYVDGIKDGLQCCGAGTEAYNSYEQMCCFSKVFDIPENSGMCCRGVGYKIDDESSPCKTIMCGGAPIDPEQFICCRNRKFSIIQGDSCCGNDPYYKQESTCCGDRRLFDGANRACCGTKAFHDDGKMCCGDLEIMPVKSTKRKCCGNLLPYCPSDNLCDENGHVSIFYIKNPPPKTVCPFDEEEMQGVRDQWPMFYCSHKMVMFGQVFKIVQTDKRTLIFLNRLRRVSNEFGYRSWMERLRIILPDFCKNCEHLVGKNLMISTDRLPTRQAISFRSAHKYFVTTLDKDLRRKVKSYKKCQQLLG